MATDFEISLNSVLVDTFHYIQKYEELSLKKALKVPITIGEAHMIEVISKIGRQKNSITTSRIASMLSITLPTATVAIKKMESKGFIKKSPCETDGRITMISLTELGEKIDRAHRVFHEKMVRNISSQIVDNEKDILLTVIHKLNDFFRIKVEE